MRIVRRIAYVLLGFLVLAWALASAYFLPFDDKVRITGTEVKREDVAGADGLRGGRDVRYIMATTLDGEVRAYRNEDTGWGFPPYFKFNSGDLAAQAQAIARNQPEAVVLVRHYGMRAQLASLYPNALSLRVVEADYEPFPVFVIVYLVLCFALLVIAYIAVRRLARWRPFKKKTPADGDGASDEDVRDGPSDSSGEPA